MEIVRDTLTQKPDLISGLIRLITLDIDPDLAHRLLFIMDELREEVKLRKLVPSHIATSDVQTGLSRLLSNSKTQDLARLCESLRHDF